MKVLILVMLIWLGGAGKSQVRAAADTPPTEAEIEATVYATRKPPVQDFPVTRTIDVSRYGVTPNQETDSWPGVQKALADALKEPGAVKLVFPQGRYFLDPYQGAKPPEVGAHCIEIIHKKNMILEGNGSDFVVKNPFMGFVKVEGSHNIIVRNFSVDYDPLPTLQGVVVSADPATGLITIHVSDGYPDFNAPHIYDVKAPRVAGTLFDTATRRMKPDGHTGGWFWFNGENITPTGNRQYQLTLLARENAAAFTKGDTLAMWNNRRPVGIVRVIHSDLVTVMNVTTYATPNTAFSGEQASEMGLLNCRILPKPGRMAATNADSFTIFGGARVGPWMEGCDFENVVDDISQNESFRLGIAAVVSNRAIKTNYLATIFPDELSPGDTIVFFNLQAAAPFFEAKVLALDRKGKIVMFDRDLPVSEIFADTPNQTRDVTVMFNKNSSASNFVIKNNLFKNGMGDGIISYNPKANGIIEGNTFENISAASVGFTNHGSPTYFAGLLTPTTRGIFKNLTGANTNLSDPPAFVENILIRNNTFSDGLTAQRAGKEDSGAINFFFTDLKWALTSKAIGFKNIVIKENTFKNIPRQLTLRIENCRDVLIEDNKFIETSSDPEMAEFMAHPELAQSQGLIGIKNSKGVRIKDNQASDERKGMVFVHVGPNTREVQVSNNVLNGAALSQ